MQGHRGRVNAGAMRRIIEQKKPKQERKK